MMASLGPSTILQPAVGTTQCHHAEKAALFPACRSLSKHNHQLKYHTLRLSDAAPPIPARDTCRFSAHLPVSHWMASKRVYNHQGERTYGEMKAPAFAPRQHLSAPSRVLPVRNFADRLHASPPVRTSSAQKQALCPRLSFAFCSCRVSRDVRCPFATRPGATFRDISGNMDTDHSHTERAISAHLFPACLLRQRARQTWQTLVLFLSTTSIADPDLT